MNPLYLNPIGLFVDAVKNGQEFIIAIQYAMKTSQYADEAAKNGADEAAKEFAPEYKDINASFEQLRAFREECLAQKDDYYKMLKPIMELLERQRDSLVRRLTVTGKEICKTYNIDMGAITALTKFSPRTKHTKNAVEDEYVPNFTMPGFDDARLNLEGVDIAALLAPSFWTSSPLENVIWLIMKNFNKKVSKAKKDEYADIKQTHEKKIAELKKQLEQDRADDEEKCRSMMNLIDDMILEIAKLECEIRELSVLRKENGAA